MMSNKMLNYLKQRISDSPLGYISYAEFIEAALYHPEYGYYMKEGVKIGREGDFYTTSNISDLYGRLVAKWYGKLVREYGLSANVCEIGAGTGRFAKAFIEEWHKSMTEPLSYTLVEASPYHRQIQKESLDTFWELNIIQVENLSDIKDFDGLIFSNELFDALPVHVIQKVEGDLFEVIITCQENQLTEVLVPLGNEQIQQFLTEHQIRMRNSQRIEIPLAMEKMIRTISECMVRGVIVTVDYGYTNEEWQEPARNDGSLRGFHKHQLIDNILLNPGEMDITSHVHLDVLIDEGEKAGLTYIEKLRQDQFLLSIGILNELQDSFDPNPFSELSKRNRAIKSLIMPGGLSPFFHVILQQKGLDDKAVHFVEKK
jgi:SAM-dependent MidA family methyltransferase